jgi:hypothetical protein
MTEHALYLSTDALSIDLRGRGMLSSNICLTNNPEAIQSPA